jgi:hypothetical protein
MFTIFIKYSETKITSIIFLFFNGPVASGLIKAFKIVGELLVDLEVSNSQKREEITQPQYTILEKSDNEKDPEHYQKDKRGLFSAVSCLRENFGPNMA